MPRFFVLSGPDLGKSFELGEGALFGRAPDCAAPMRASSISRHHARLEREGERWVLVDLGSRNGIQREGARVERLALVDGAVFQLGDVELRFRAQDEARARPVAIPPPPEPASAPPIQSAPEPAEASNGREDELEIEIEEVVLEQEASLGRAPAAPARSAPRPTPERPSMPARAATSGAAASLGAPGRAGRAGRSAPRAAVELRDAGRPVLQFHKVADARGFALSDLAQQPGWVKLLVGLVAAALFAALFYAAFRGTTYLRSRAQGDATALEGTLEGDAATR